MTDAEYRLRAVGASASHVQRLEPSCSWLALVVYDGEQLAMGVAATPETALEQAADRAERDRHMQCSFWRDLPVMRRRQVWSAIAKAARKGGAGVADGGCARLAAEALKRPSCGEVR